MQSAVIADTQARFRQCLRGLLEARGVQVAGEAADVAEALQLVRQLKPDLLVLDSDLLPVDAAALARELRMHASPPQLLVLTAYASENAVLETFRAGIQALVPKGSVGTEIGAALYAMSNGRTYLSPAIMETLVKSWPVAAAQPAADLSPVEQSVLRLLVQDNSPATIAARLQLDNNMVEACRAILYKKLQCTNMGGLVRHALRMGCSVARESA